jgi:hypothetical protein
MDIRKLLEEIKALDTLWTVAQQFRDMMASWFEDPLSELDSQVMETQTEDWNIEVKRLQKSIFIQSSVKQTEVL